MGPVFVMLASTVLTITILGSAVYLGVRFYEKKRREREIQNFVQALPNRSPAELAEQARELQQRKGVQQYLLPEIRRTMLAGQTEQQRWSAIRISEAFLESKGVRKTLRRTARLPQERLAAEATRVLSRAKPPEAAAELMTTCLKDAICPAVVDEACAAFYDLGEVGLNSITQCADELSSGRKLWLVRYVAEQERTDNQQQWLAWLSKASDEAVQEAARASIARLNQPTTVAGNAQRQ